ncbi:MAG: HAMP domain-containing sensor histidine kinase, partial [Raoultibacter sp.]
RLGIVDLNEARAAIASDSPATADVALAGAQDTLRTVAETRSMGSAVVIWVLTIAGIVGIWAMAAYLYASVVRPFARLESFAEEVANGNLEMPLAYERSNPFGRFTWAFDNMRKEIKRARTAEALAIEQTKTTAAVLSHDIKTPIASIRAYSEALELGVAQTDAEQADYARTIMRKCDEVAQLTDDLFLHALADLDHITVVCKNTPIHEVVRHSVNDFDATGDVRIGRVDEAWVSIDAKRLEQALENIVANARKYAPHSSIDVEGICKNGTYRLMVRDFGPGIPPEDMPFVFDRFYRGLNIGDAPGAGLGLFIVRYLVEQMNGTARAEHAEPGLRVTLEFPFSS